MADKVKQTTHLIVQCRAGDLTRELCGRALEAIGSSVDREAQWEALRRRAAGEPGEPPEGAPLSLDLFNAANELGLPLADPDELLLEVYGKAAAKHFEQAAERLLPAVPARFAFACDASFTLAVVRAYRERPDAVPPRCAWEKFVWPWQYMPETPPPIRLPSKIAGIEPVKGGWTRLRIFEGLDTGNAAVYRATAKVLSKWCPWELLK